MQTRHILRFAEGLCRKALSQLARVHLLSNVNRAGYILTVFQFAVLGVLLVLDITVQIPLKYASSLIENIESGRWSSAQECFTFITTAAVLLGLTIATSVLVHAADDALHNFRAVSSLRCTYVQWLFLPVPIFSFVSIAIHAYSSYVVLLMQVQGDDLLPEPANGHGDDDASNEAWQFTVQAAACTMISCWIAWVIFAAGFNRTWTATLRQQRICGRLTASRLLGWSLPALLLCTLLYRMHPQSQELDPVLQALAGSPDASPLHYLAAGDPLAEQLVLMLTNLVLQTAWLCWATLFLFFILRAIPYGATPDTKINELPQAAQLTAVLQSIQTTAAIVTLVRVVPRQGFEYALLMVSAVAVLLMLIYVATAMVILTTQAVKSYINRSQALEQSGPWDMECIPEEQQALTLWTCLSVAWKHVSRLTAQFFAGRNIVLRLLIFAGVASVLTWFCYKHSRFMAPGALICVWGGALWAMLLPERVGVHLQHVVIQPLADAAHSARTTAHNAFRMAQSYVETTAADTDVTDLNIDAPKHASALSFSGPSGTPALQDLQPQRRRSPSPVPTSLTEQAFQGPGTGSSGMGLANTSRRIVRSDSDLSVGSTASRSSRHVWVAVVISKRMFLAAVRVMFVVLLAIASTFFVLSSLSYLPTSTKLQTVKYRVNQTHVSVSNYELALMDLMINPEGLTAYQLARLAAFHNGTDGGVLSAGHAVETTASHPTLCDGLPLPLKLDHADMCPMGPPPAHSRSQSSPDQCHSMLRSRLPSFGANYWQNFFSAPSMTATRAPDNPGLTLRRAKQAQQLGGPKFSRPYSLQNSWMQAEKSRNLEYQVCHLRWAEKKLSILDLALLAEASYFKSSHVSFDSLLMTLFPAPHTDNRTSLFRLEYEGKKVQFYEFYSPQYDLSVISIAGTDVTRIADIIEDVKIWIEAALFKVASSVLPTMRLWNPMFVSQGIKAMHSIIAFFGFENELVYYNEVIAHTRKIMQHRPVVLTGHSLGGGIANIVGSFVHRPSIAFSAPGIRQSRAKFCLTFRLTNGTLGLEAMPASAHFVRAIGRDTVQVCLRDRDIYHRTTVIAPSRDTVPMIDKHAGLVQHIRCKEHGSLGCHFMETTLCELFNSCGDPRGRFLQCHMQQGQWSEAAKEWASWVRIFFQSIFDIVDDYPLTQVGYLLLASGIMYLYLRPQADDDEDEAMTSPQTGPIASSSPTLGSSSTLSR